MMRRAALVVTVLMPALPAFAESLTVRIADDACAHAIAHAPAPDVAYRPGVDVGGRPVAPADLPGGAGLALPGAYAVPVTIDLAGGYGLPGGIPGLGAEAEIGVVTIEGDRLSFNGRPLAPTDAEAVAAACRAATR